MKPKSKFDLGKFDVDKFDRILSRGLSTGLGIQGEQVCIEAAICETLGLPHGDDPQCVAEAVREFKIRINDSNWSSPTARSSGLRDLGLAQLGSKGVISDIEFSKRIVEKTIRILIPKLFRSVFADNKDCLKAALRCEVKGTYGAAEAAAEAAEAAAEKAALAAAETAEAAAEARWAARWAAWAAEAAAEARWAARARAARWAAEAAARAERAAETPETAARARAALAAEAAWAAAETAETTEAARAAAETAASAASDTYLILSANLALKVLRELNSPGIALLK